jgi:23S rRNA (adenine2503-C2)-methyltransferase
LIHNSGPLNILALTCEELAGEMKRRYGKGLYHAAAICREILKKGNNSFARAVEFSRSPSLAVQLERDMRLPSCRIVERLEDEGVVKFASALADDQIIESVIIPAQGRTTLCISSQAGCRMGCRFCTTGEMGFKRNLTPDEMVWQIYAARFELNRNSERIPRSLLRGERASPKQIESPREVEDSLQLAAGSFNHPIDNVVFMGMGEPLDNLENVVQAVRVMSDQRGLDIPLSRITVSTSGLADAIRELAALHLRRLRLAVSINAATDELRTRLMPVNSRYPLARLREELSAFPVGRDGVIFIEYVLFDGINDSQEDARGLAGYLEGLPVGVNVIACNPGAAGPWISPSPEKARRFCGWLAEEGLFVRLRRSRGQNIMAACGQLGAKPEVRGLRSEVGKGQRKTEPQRR